MRSIERRFEIYFTHGEIPYINFIYKVKQNYEPVEKYRDINYKFSLESVPCYFGGKRWFFICGLYKNGKYCGRRVAILYIAGDYFGCRYCANLSYESCNENKSTKYAFLNIISKSWKADEYLATLKRRIYRGSLTKKFRRYLKMSNFNKDTVETALEQMNRILTKQK